MKRILLSVLFLFCIGSIFADSAWQYNPNERLITNGTDGDMDNQFSCDFPEANEGTFAALLDENLNTFFTSSWEGTAPAPDDHPHYLQVDLKDQPQSKIFFTYSIRDDSYGQSNRPATMIIYASNDAKSWTKVKEYKAGELPTDFSVKTFTSEMIDLGTSNRYLRFSIPTTNGGGSIGNYPYFAISEFQIYKATEVLDAASILSIRLNQVKALQASYLPGTDPGFYPEDQVTALNDIIEKCDNYLSEKHTDAEYTALLGDLNSTFSALKENPIKDGYFYIESAYAPFNASQPNIVKAMYANSGMLYWETLDNTDPKFVFHVVQLNDKNYSVQNLATKEFIKNLYTNNDQNDTQVATSETQEVSQKFEELGSGQFLITNDIIQPHYGYNVQGHNSGSGSNGIVCRWISSSNGECAWTLKEITDQDLLNTLLNKVLTKTLDDAIQAAENTRNKVIDHAALITNVDQLSTNNSSADDQSALGHLIDGNLNTIFHSHWDAAMADVNTTADSWTDIQNKWIASNSNNIAIGTGYHNIQVKLNEPVSKFYLTYTGRDETDYHDNPNDIEIYATNDDVLGASVLASESNSWTKITELKDGFPKNIGLASYTSPNIDLGTPYKYIRFVIKGTTNENIEGISRQFVVPDITGVTWNVSEFQVYDVTPSASSEYNMITGMKSACDALDALISADKAKVSLQTVTQADIDALKAATDAVNKLYIDRDDLDNQLAALLDSAQIVCDKAMGSKQALITSVDQLYTNSSSADNASSLANLIDGKTSTIFHSHWDAAMADPATTAENWDALQKTWITNNSNNIAIGTGYHNLQVKMAQPIHKFYFQYTGQTDATWHDNPNDIQIFATNDDVLGASVLNSESSKWAEITELKDGFPENVGSAQYTSPSIDLNGSYKYIRFVIKGTTNQNCPGLDRKFAVPDITGITWNVSEFQMYSTLDPQYAQYNYVPALKEAVDVMKALMDVDKKLGKHSFLTTEPITTLRSAINKALALYADSTELSALYGKYKTYADSSAVGEGIGFVKTQDAIHTFRSAINDAKSGVSLTKPTKDMLTTATDAMKNAFTTFMTNVNQIVPNQWYNILSGSDNPYAQNQPIFLVSTSTGTQLKIGGYDLSQIDPNTDPYCIWRFVPIEGQVGQYAIQNLGTGQYFGAYRGKGSDNSPLMSHVKAPYQLQYYGNGKFKLIQAGVTDEDNCLKADGTAFVVLNWPANPHSEQAWKFEPIKADDELSFNSMPDNSIQIMTLPFENKGDLSIAEMNDFAQTYAIKSLTVTESGSKLELTKKDDFEAGEPFILMINDYTKYDASANKQPISISVPTSEIDTSTIVANGLVGTLQGLTISKPGLGIFKDSKLAATGSSNLSIAGREGYINPNLVTTQEGNTDLTIEIGDLLNEVKSVVVNKSTDKVNVYTIDGKLLKQNVKATEARKGLNKGLYIIGKKKAIVR